MSINTDINNRVQTIRNIFNKTQKEFSQELGFTQSTISKIENNKIPVTEDIAMKIEEIFGFSSNWILTGENPFLHINTSNENDLLQNLKIIYGLSSFDLDVVKHFLNLNQEQRNIIYSIFSNK